MARNYAVLQMELLNKTQHNKKLREHINGLRKELLQARTMQKNLIQSYEEVVKEWQISYKDLINNGWKLLFVKVQHKMKGI